jgi:hypothetical protein
MFTNPTTSPATEILKATRTNLFLLAKDVATCDIQLLETISSIASQLAQDLRVQEDILLAMCDQHEAEMAEAIVAAADRADAEIAHLV